jgi:hypothetical protein
MSRSFYKTVVFSGLGCMVHAAYSAAEWRYYSRGSDLHYMILPVDIIIQTVLSLILTMTGVLFIAGDFKEIRATEELEGQSWETLKNRPSFYTFCHRGKSFSPFYTPPGLSPLADNSCAGNIVSDIPSRFMS